MARASRLARRSEMLLELHADQRVWRRLVRDYERRLDVSEAMIPIAMASILLLGNAHP